MWVLITRVNRYLSLGMLLFTMLLEIDSFQSKNGLFDLKWAYFEHSEFQIGILNSLSSILLELS